MFWLLARRRTLLLAAVLAVPPTPAPAGAQASVPDLPVPFVPQGELLCGGAAVAMVLRYQGVRQVRADDFADLVRPEEGGIRTGDLARAVEARGWSVRSGPSDLDALAAALAGNEPPVVLLSGAGRRHHYVTVVGMSASEVRVHDPARGPDRPLSRSDFMRRWRAAGAWALVVGAPAAEGTPVGAPSPDPSGSGRPDAAISSGDGERAPPDPALLRATERFRDGDWAAAAHWAERAAARRPDDGDAWRVLAVSRYLGGNPDGALSAWNRVDGPVLDLVRVRGLGRTRVPVVHRLAGLEPGQSLTASALARARRRVALLPAAAATRVSYRPVDDRLTEVEIAVAERPLLPRSRGDLLGDLASALVRDEVELTVASPLGAGEAFILTGRWMSATPGASLSLEAPDALGLPGITAISIALGEERYDDGTTVGSTRAALRHEDWLTGRWGWWMEAAVEEWRDGVTGGSAAGGLRWRTPDDRAEVRARVLGGRKREAFTTVHLGAAWRSTARREGRVLHLRASGDLASPATPRPLWPGAGTGTARPALLRAHPLVRGDALALDGMGRGMLSGGVEVVEWGTPLPPLRIGGALFLDGAHIGRRATDSDLPGTLVDAGVGLRIALPGMRGQLAVDAAVGLRDRRRAFTVSWRRGWMP